MRNVALVALAVATGCGGGKHAAAPAAGGAPDCDDPGRCLPDIAKLVGEHRDEARACYDQGRKRDPKLEGKLVLKFVIDASGSVTDATETSSDTEITDAGVIACIGATIMTIKFPASTKGKTTRAYHKFEFHPR